MSINRTVVPRINYATEIIHATENGVGLGIRLQLVIQDVDLPATFIDFDARSLTLNIYGVSHLSFEIQHQPKTSLL